MNIGMVYLVTNQGFVRFDRDLTKPELLQRCLKGRTQNPNESLHAKVWRKTSKGKYCGLSWVTFATQVTVLEHNFGHTDSNFLLALGLQNSPHMLASLQKKDLGTKKRMETPKGKKTKKRKIGEDEEEYQPGGF